MKLNIQTQNVQPNPLLMAFVRERMRHAMRHHSEEISSIDVYIKDANGPRGGEDKLVRVRAYFRNRASLVARARRSNLLAAVVVASRRLKRSAQRMKISRTFDSKQPLTQLQYEGL